MIKKISLLLILVLFIVVCILELGLRMFMPTLGADLFESGVPQESRFIYNTEYSYEYKPYANITYTDKGSVIYKDLINNEGFRGPDYTIPKPPDVFRILVVGDSLVEGIYVRYADTWEKLLENSLNRFSISSQSEIKYQVINAGVEGYVSWQTLERLRGRGIKYQPDLVLVMVGINDLIYSTLPNWKENIDLTKMEQVTNIPSHHEIGCLSSILISICRYSYFVRFIRQIKNNVFNAFCRWNIIRQHQKDSVLLFNEKALELYLKNLESIFMVIEASKARMGLIIWSTILTPELLHDSDIQQRLFLIYANFPVFTHQLWDFNMRYTKAMRKFCAAHPNIIIFDAEAEFKGKNKKERLLLFQDWAHLTVPGQRILAEIMFQSLKQK